MDAEQVPQAVTFTLVFLVAALGLWYCGVRFNKLALKQIAVMLGMAPVIMLAIQIFGPYLTQIDYRVYADGPPPDQPSTTATVRLNVNNPELRHRFELVPRIRGNDPPQQPVHLKFTLRSPKGEALAQREGDLAPAKWEWYRWRNSGAPMRWNPLRGEFQPQEEGEYTLAVEIPQPVQRVDIFVRESRK